MKVLLLLPGHLIHWPLIAPHGSWAAQFKRPWFTPFHVHMIPYNIYSVDTPVLQCNVTLAWWRVQYSRAFVCECTALGLCLELWPSKSVTRSQTLELLTFNPEASIQKIPCFTFPKSPPMWNITLVACLTFFSSLVLFSWSSVYILQAFSSVQ